MRRIPILLLLLALATAFVAAPIAPWPHVAALADDDDDDDGGGGFSRSGGGNADIRKPARLKKKKAVRARPAATAQRRAAPARPSRVRFELVVSGLDGNTSQFLQARGYRIISEAALQSQPDRTLTRLRVPRGIAIERARAEVAAAGISLIVDLNHYYRPGKDRPCAGQSCAALELVAWPSPGQLQCGPAPDIGMVDTRVDTTHELLKGSTIETVNMRRDGLAQSSAQHGTAVAALLVGAAGSRAPGLVPEAKLLAADPFHRGEGGDDRVDVFDLVRAIDHLVARKPDALNLSLSGPANLLLEESVAVALGTGVPVVAAAGNAGPGSKPQYPAAYDGVIAVTAVDGKLSVYRRAVQGAYVDFAAPGVGLWTAAPEGGLKRASGTSYASPFVTAAAARVRAANPGIPPTQIAQRLALAALDLGKPGKDETFGYGLIRGAGLCGARPGGT